MIEATASPHDGRVARLELRGVATGYETIRLATGHGAATPFFVVANSVAVDSLFVGALSPASTELRLAPAGALPPNPDPKPAGALPPNPDPKPAGALPPRTGSGVGHVQG